MNFQANKHNRQLCLALLFVILTVTGVRLYLRLYMCADQTSMERSISIQKISETAYRNALAEEKTSTVWDGKNSSPVCPERGTADYYQVSVLDAGYNNELPINANIYFAVIPSEGLVEESCFTLMEMPESPRYQNMITYATDAVNADVFLKLEISVVGYYDADGQPVRSEDFAYALSCFCDLAALEIQQLRMTGEGFRPENGSSPADALIGSYTDAMGSSLAIRKNADGGDGEGPAEMRTQAGTAPVEECGAKGRCDPAGVLTQFGEPDGSQPHGPGRSGALGYGVV